MAYRQRTLGRLGRPIRPTAQTITIPASVGGVNALDPLMSTPPQDCIYTYNLMPGERGLRLRKGYREWATGIGDTDTEVRTILPFQGQDPTNDKLWAVTADGIWDITTYNTTAPVHDVTFSAKTNDAGYGVWTEMTLDTGAQVLFYADPENGLHQYTESTATWTVPSLTGPTVADIAFVVLHKQRLWVIEKGSGDAWYGPVDGIAGTFTKFTFGSKFTYGGILVGLWSWTIDGGAGVDDFLVAISRGGDVLVYQGSDPSLEDFGAIGDWFIGELPDSRKVVEKHGGEMYVLSTFGITSLRDLLQGVASYADQASASTKVNRPLQADVIAKKSDYGWALQIFPPDGFMQILVPFSAENASYQYTQNLLTRAWGYWDNVPAKCADIWNSDYFIGADSGRVFQYYGTVDNAQLDGTLGTAINFSCLTSFQGYDSHALNKQIGIMRVVGVTSGMTAYSLSAVYDYAINAEALSPSGIASSTAAVWGTSKWGQAVWGTVQAGELVAKGAAGLGSTVAIAMKGSANERITVVAWDASMVSGGFL